MKIMSENSTDEKYHFRVAVRIRPITEVERRKDDSKSRASADTAQAMASSLSFMKVSEQNEVILTLPSSSSTILGPATSTPRGTPSKTPQTSSNSGFRSPRTFPRKTSLPTGGNELPSPALLTHHVYAFDQVFDSRELPFSAADQQRVYSALGAPLVDTAMEGFNASLFAYGMTATGKSYSIMGSDSEPGIVPRLCEDLLQRVHALTSSESHASARVDVSYYEIYNERIYDLLNVANKKTTLNVREHPQHGPFVEGLSNFAVTSVTEIQQWIQLGNRQRVTASTGCNDKSSRSHAVFVLEVTQKRETLCEDLEEMRNGAEVETPTMLSHRRHSRIFLVDLAGSERQRDTANFGNRLQESKNINQSLLALGKVISVLAESQQSQNTKLHIPYRDSLLTWLLKESLGGNAKTTMLATVSPALCHLEETVNTLKYATKARSIVSRVHMNEDTQSKAVRELVHRLNQLVERSQQENQLENEISMLKCLLLEKQRLIDQLDEEWRHKLQESQQAAARALSEAHRQLELNSPEHQSAVSQENSAMDSSPSTSAAAVVCRGSKRLRLSEIPPASNVSNCDVLLEQVFKQVAAVQGEISLSCGSQVNQVHGLIRDLLSQLDLGEDGPDADGVAQVALGVTLVRLLEAVRGVLLAAGTSTSSSATSVARVKSSCVTLVEQVRNLGASGEILVSCRQQVLWDAAASLMQTIARLLALDAFSRASAFYFMPFIIRESSFDSLLMEAMKHGLLDAIGDLHSICATEIEQKERLDPAPPPPLVVAPVLAEFGRLQDSFSRLFRSHSVQMRNNLQARQSTDFPLQCQEHFLWLLKAKETFHNMHQYLEVKRRVLKPAYSPQQLTSLEDVRRLQVFCANLKPIIQALCSLAEDSEAANYLEALMELLREAHSSLTASRRRREVGTAGSSLSGSSSGGRN